MNIRVITSYPKLAEEVCSLLNENRAHATPCIVDDCTSYSIMVSKKNVDYCIPMASMFIREYEDKFADINLIIDLLKPFHFNQITVTDLDDGVDLQISLGTADADMPASVQIIAGSLKERDLVHQRITDAGFDACILEIQTFDTPMVRHGFKNNMFTPCYAAWCAGMPRETVFEYDPNLIGITGLCVVDQGQLQQLQRKYQPITIRCDHEMMGQRLRDYLLGLGYTINNLLIYEDARLSRAEIFGLNLRSISKQQSLNPAFDWLLSDLQTGVESWLSDHEVDLKKHPFEKTDMKLMGEYESIVIDIPWSSYLSGDIPPYGFGFPGRYTTILATNKPESVEPLAIRLEKEAGMQEVVIFREYGVTDPEIVFSGEITTDSKAQEKIVNTVIRFMQERNLPADTLNIRSTPPHAYKPVIIHFPVIKEGMNTPTEHELANGRDEPQ